MRIKANNNHNKLGRVINKQKTSNNVTKYDKSSKLTIEMGPTKLVWVSSAVIKENEMKCDKEMYKLIEKEFGRNNK